MSIRIANHSRHAVALLAVTLIIAVLKHSSPAMVSPSQEQARLIPAASQSETQWVVDPAAILASARALYVSSRTGFVKSEVIESELLKRSAFQQTGMIITKDQTRADLVMEVRRSNFTTEYPYVVIDSRTRVVVASGKVNSLFGTAAAKIAKGFIKQLQKSRSSSPAPSKKT